MAGDSRRFAVAVASVTLLAGLVACGSESPDADPTGENTQPSIAENTGPTACLDHDNCRIVAETDVDGDGRADQVGWEAAGKNAVVVRVATAAGEVLQHRVDVTLWRFGGRWAGAAAIDGEPGDELLVGSSLGAHTPGYTLLTYRDGGLAVLDSPLGEDRWYVDGAYSIAVGWWREATGAEVTMTYRWAQRTPRDTFRGTETTYAWRNGAWAEQGSHPLSYRQERAAFAIAGWHVPGLDTFPGLDLPNGDA